MVLCKEEQILNPLTQRCVAINGAVGKNIIKQHFDGKLSLDAESLQKIPMPKMKKVKATTPKQQPFPMPKMKMKKIKATTPTPTPIPFPTPLNLTLSSKKNKATTPMPSPMPFPTPLKKSELSNKTRMKVKTFLEEWRLKKKAEDTTFYCKTLNISNLKKPIVHMNVAIDFPVTRLRSMNVDFTPLTLNDTPVFEHTKSEGFTIEFNNYSLKRLLLKGHTDGMKYFEDLIDMTWLKKMNTYISELSIRDMYTLIGYTHVGDVLANQYMRKTFDVARFNKLLRDFPQWFNAYFPLFFQAISKIENTEHLQDIIKYDTEIKIFELARKTVYLKPSQSKQLIVSNQKMNVSDILKRIKSNQVQEQEQASDRLIQSDIYTLLFSVAPHLTHDFWEDVIGQYTRDLDAIISKSPSTTTQMIVYRGIQHDSYMTGTKNNVYKTDGFVSTSLHLQSALFFSGEECCFKRIILLPGTKIILLSGISKYVKEIELLLGSKSQFYVTNNDQKIPLSTVDICKNNSPEITVIDLVVVK